MIKNYLKIAWRNLVKHKTFTLLNIIGLSVAFAVAILLGITAIFDLSYDNFHKNSDKLYQVYSVKQTPQGVEMASSNPMPMANALKEEMPEIDKISRCLYYPAIAEHNANNFRLSINWVDSDFTSMFTFPTILGNASEGLKDKNTIVLTETTAKKIFGKTVVIGETILLQQRGELQPFKVAAVLKDIPKNSSLNFEALINIKSFSEYNRFADDWSSRNHDVFVQLKNEISATQFEDNTDTFAALHYQEDIETAKRDGAQPNAEGTFFNLKLLPYKNVHFTSFAGNVLKISRTYSNLLIAISVLLLFIACVNFVNMSIAGSGKRLKEIGMRKTLGAHKKQVFFQFWSESLIVFVLALMLGIVLSYLLLPQFQQLFNTQASFSQFNNSTAIVFTILFVFLVSLFAGGYPALVMSKLGTIQALKGKLSVKSGNTLQNTLIVVQFSIAILMITGTIVLYSQLQYMRTKDLGYNKEQVVSFLMNGKKDAEQVVQLLRTKFADNPNILGVSASDINLGRGRDGSSYRSMLGFEYKGREVKTNMLIVDYDFPETLDIPLLSGRTFDKNRPADSLAVLVNETMAKSLNETDVLSQSIMVDSTNYAIIGVVKDYNFEKLNKAVAPITLFFTNCNWKTQYAFVKVAPQNMASTYDFIKKTWSSIEPDTPFLGSFLDENIDRTLAKERNMITMISSGALIAIVLSCIGLFAMSLLIVSSRTKEIGIRKVVGASVTSITYLLTKDFLKLVAIAFLIASPIAWWFLSNWLQEYTYKINLSFWFFALAGLIAVVIAVLTIGIKTIKAAIQNPTKSLRTE